MRKRYLHIYYNAGKCAGERTSFAKKLDKMERYMTKMQSPSSNH